jgi:hypothetical protein
MCVILESLSYSFISISPLTNGGRRGRDRQCLSLLLLWVRILIWARCTTLCDKVYQWFVTDRLFSPDPPVSFTIIDDRHDIAEILLIVALNTIKQTNKQTNILRYMNICLMKWRIWIIWMINSQYTGDTLFLPPLDPHQTMR